VFIWICCVVFSPVDFIDETDRRWTVAACFIVLSGTVLNDMNIVDSIEPQNDPYYDTNFHWVTGQSTLRFS